MTTPRKVQVIYGGMTERISRRATERLIHLLNAMQEHPLPIPASPVAEFWCRKTADGLAPPYIIGYTCPVFEQTKSTHDAPGRTGPALARCTSGNAEHDAHNLRDMAN